MSSNFCPYCGQSTALHPPSAWEFVHEFATHYVAVEGKLWRTLALLTLHPGRLTKEFLSGRRQRYIVPLRLYITASFLFFAVTQLMTSELSPIVTIDRPAAADLRDAANGGGVVVLVPGLPLAAVKNEPGKADDRIDRMFDKESTPEARTAELDDWMAQAGILPPGVGLKDCAYDPAVCSSWRRHLARTAQSIAKDPEEFIARFTERFHHSLSYAMFLALPVFAGLLGIAYWGRKMYYGEHLVFALHVHSFWFLLALLFAFLPRLSPFVPLGFAVYGLWAMQRVYGGRRIFTALRAAAVAVLYALVVVFGASTLAVGLLVT